MVSVAKVETIRPPMTARPSGAACAPPSPNPMAMGTMPKIIAAAVIRMARRRLAAPSRAASQQRLAFVPRAFGERDQQNRVGHRDPDRHDRAHERLNVERGAGRQQHQQDAAEHRRNGQNDGERQAHGLEIRREQQKDHEHRQQQPDAQSGDGLLERAESRRAYVHRDAARRSARRRHSAGSILAAASPSVMPWMLAVRLTTRWPL